MTAFYNLKGRNLLQKKNTSILLTSLRKHLIWVNSIFFPKYKSHCDEVCSNILQYILIKINFDKEFLKGV